MLTDPIIMVVDSLEYVVRPPTWAVIELDVIDNFRQYWIRSLTICEREAITEIADSLTLFPDSKHAKWRTFAAKVIASPYNAVDVPLYKDNPPVWCLCKVPFRVTTGMTIRGLLAGPRTRITPIASEVPNAVREQYRKR